MLARAVTQQSGAARRVNRLHLPFSIAEGTPWADDPHLPPPGKLYQYLASAHGELAWAERIRARMPIGDESRSLSVPPGVPQLVVLRVASGHTGHADAGKPLALEEIRYRADQAELHYTLC